MRLLYYELYYGSVKHCKSTETTFLVLNLFGDCSSEMSLSASWRLVTKIQRWLICRGWFMKGHFKSDGEMLSSLEIILVNFISHLVIYLFINLGCWCEIRSLKHTEVVPSKWREKWEIMEMLFNLSKDHFENPMLDASDGTQLQSTWNRTKRDRFFFFFPCSRWTLINLRNLFFST